MKMEILWEEMAMKRRTQPDDTAASSARCALWFICAAACRAGRSRTEISRAAPRPMELTRENTRWRQESCACGEKAEGDTVYEIHLDGLPDRERLHSSVYIKRAHAARAGATCTIV
jgi:hypothetical protein